MAIGQCRYCGERVRVGTAHACAARVGDVMSRDVPGYEYGQGVSADITGPSSRNAPSEGRFPGPGLTAYDKVATGNQTFPIATPPATPDGVGIAVLQREWHEAEPRVLTIGLAPPNPVLGAPFPPIVVNGEVPAVMMGGLVASGGVALGDGPYAAGTLEYGAGSATQKVWMDFFQGSINVPPCNWLRYSVLPWGAGWAGVALNSLVAKAVCVPGQLQGAHVPTLTARGFFSAGLARLFTVPSNARAVDVYCEDPATNVTITIRDGASGVRNYSTGTIIPGWTPLTVNPARGALTVLASVDATLVVTFFLEL